MTYLSIIKENPDPYPNLILLNMDKSTNFCNSVLFMFKWILQYGENLKKSENTNLYTGVWKK